MKALDKWIKRLIVAAAILLLAWLFLPKLHLMSSIENWLKPKSVLIDNTPLTIKQIKTIALLNTASFAQDIVLDTVIETPSKYSSLNVPFMPIPFAATDKKEIVLVIQGKVTAGINLQNLPDSAVFTDGDSVRIHMPPAKVTDVFINPSGIETFYEAGTWTNAETNQLLLVARGRLTMAAERHRLLQLATEKARAVMEQFLTASGFKHILIMDN